MQWMCKYNQGNNSFDKIREELLEYVEIYNNTIHSSLIGKTPNQRFFGQAELIKYLNAKDLNEAFMVKFER